MSTLPWKRSLLAFALAATTALTGCPDGTDPTPNPDSGTDAGSDAGSDAGTDGGDGDGGTDPIETGGPESSAQIQAVRDATPGAVSPALPVNEVAVTHILEAHAEDPAGFFVQAEADGPALFVAVDPSTLELELAVGDLVSFEVTGVLTEEQQHRVSSITALTRSVRDFDVDLLVRDLSAVDLVEGLTANESTLSILTLELDDARAECPNGLDCFVGSSVGLDDDALERLRLRVTPEVTASLSVRAGCTVTAGPTPLWRHATVAQPSAWSDAELAVDACPPVQALDAVAYGPTEVRVTFDTTVAAATAGVASAYTIVTEGGAQLAVTSASVSGNVVTLTTAAQAGGAAYTIQLADTVTDGNGTPIAAGSTVDFEGFSAQAQLVINEVDALGACDNIELRVIQGGSLAGFKLTSSASAVAYTFPDVVVQRNDLVVVHASHNFSPCTSLVGRTTVPQDELSAPDAVSHPENHPGAFDLWSNIVSLGTAQLGLVLQDDLGAYQDAFVTASTSITQSAVLNLMNGAAADGHWTNADQTVPAGGFTLATLFEAAVINSGVNNSVLSTSSLQRSVNVDSNSKVDWSQPALSIGALNAGQSPL